METDTALTELLIYDDIDPEKVISAHGHYISQQIRLLRQDINKYQQETNDKINSIRTDQAKNYITKKELMWAIGIVATISMVLLGGLIKLGFHASNRDLATKNAIIQKLEKIENRLDKIELQK